MTTPTRPAPAARRAALAALGFACLTLAATGCSVARRHAWQSQGRGTFGDHRTAAAESEAIRGVAAPRGWWR